MDALPSTIVLDIFSRLPVKCLARSRCVSKVWCSYIDDRYLTIIHDKRLVEEPTLILYHQHRSLDRTTCSLCFHVTESKQPGTSHYVMEPKEGPFLEYFHKKPFSKYPRVDIKFQGSCNGLICLSQYDGHRVTSLAVIHPLRKECYELPPIPLLYDKYMDRESCGLGFDTFTNTWKMVCVFLKKYSSPNDSDMMKKNLCTIVHVFGTNSWREIPQVPSYRITGNAVFANGCLHWFSYVRNDDEREVIWFDVNKEEFGLIDPPKRMCDIWRNYNCYFDQLVDLNGEVGYVCARTMEVWLLNHKNKQWVPHCRVKEEIVRDGYIDVIGCWNKNGDILIKYRDNGRYLVFIYNLKNDALHKTNIVGRDDQWSPDIIMYPNDLLSIHGINTNCCSVKKTVMKKSCQQILSFD